MCKQELPAPWGYAPPRHLMRMMRTKQWSLREAWWSWMHDQAEESAERRGSGARISCRRAYATSEPEPDAAEPTAESAERLVEVAGPSGGR